MTATSPSVASQASRLLRRKHLSDADLDMVQAVAASALNQREKEASRRRITAAFQSLGTAMERAGADERLMVKLEKLGALLFPAK